MKSVSGLNSTNKLKIDKRETKLQPSNAQSQRIRLNLYKKINQYITQKENRIIGEQDKGITLVALVITILFSYDEKIKCSNSKGFLLTTI